MQKLKTFLNTIYLGDRFCEKMEIARNKIVIQINLISRIKKEHKKQDYYFEENIEHGHLVFDDVIEYFQDSELLFNDEIYEIQVIDKKDDIYCFVICGCNISDKSVSTDIQMHIWAKKFYIFDQTNNRVITE